MKITKGGTGNAAPYTTTHVRVPLPIKKSVEAQVNLFKQRVDSGELVLNGQDVYIQLPIEEKTNFEQVLNSIDDYMIHASRIAVDSPRNKNLMHFRDWVKDRIDKQG
jgi:hypothetical protein